MAGHDTLVTRLGVGVRRALFIHCSLAHSGAWIEVQAALLGRLAMTAFDRPGHGRSASYAGPGGARGVHDLTTHMAGRLIDKRADVIGHSYGGTVALRLAIEQPDKVRSLVLIEPVLFAAAQGTPAFDAYAADAAQLAETVARGDRESAARAFHDQMNPDQPWARLDARARERLTLGIDQIVEEAAITRDDAAGIVARLERIRQPILLIEGSMSPPIVRATHEALAARLPQVQRVMVVGAGHMVPVTHPDNVSTEIGAFLKV